MSGFSQRTLAPSLLVLALVGVGLVWSGSERRLLQADTLGYVWCAQSLNNGELYPSDNFYPAYPYLLALVLPRFGVDLGVIHFFPWLIGAMVPLLVYWVGVSVFREGRTIGLAAALAYLLWPLQAASMNVPATEPLAAFITVLAVLCFARIPRRPVYHAAWIICIALAALVRYDVVILASILGVAWVWVYGRERRNWVVAGAGALVGTISLVPFFRANWLRYFELTGEKRLSAALPFVKAKAWTDVTADFSLDQHVGRGSSETLSIIQHAAEITGSVSLAVALFLVMGFLGVGGLLAIRKAERPLAVICVAIYVLVYVALAVLLIHGSVLRHVSRIVPFLALLAGAGAWYWWSCLVSRERPLFARPAFLVYGAALVVVCSGSVVMHRNYMKYRDDVARASMMELITHPLDMTEFADRFIQGAIQRRPGHNLWLDHLVTQTSIRTHFDGVKWPPEMPADLLDGSEVGHALRWDQWVYDAGGVRIALESDSDALRHDDYPQFLGLMGPAQEAELLVRITTARPIAALSIVESHISALRRSSVEAALSWDGGESWQEIYSDNTLARFPHVLAERLLPDHAARPGALLRYRFATAPYPEEIAGLFGHMEVAIAFKAEPIAVDMDGGDP